MEYSVLYDIIITIIVYVIPVVDVLYTQYELDKFDLLQGFTKLAYNKYLFYYNQYCS